MATTSDAKSTLEADDFFIASVRIMAYNARRSPVLALSAALSAAVSADAKDCTCATALTRRFSYSCLSFSTSALDNDCSLLTSAMMDSRSAPSLARSCAFSASLVDFMFEMRSRKSASASATRLSAFASAACMASACAFCIAFNAT